MTQADFIRDYVLATYITPARRARLGQVTFVSGDIHEALGFVQRYPAVCDAIDARMFQTTNGLKLLKRTGPDQGATAEWTFAV